MLNCAHRVSALTPDVQAEVAETFLWLRKFWRRIACHTDYVSSVTTKMQCMQSICHMAWKDYPAQPGEQCLQHGLSRCHPRVCLTRARVRFPVVTLMM